MALHTFVAGDVLEAQQLNDSFAAVGGGLKVVKADTAFTAVSSVTVDNVFSATYRNYKIMLTYVAASANIELRVRTGGSSISTATYNVQRLLAGSTTVSAARSSSATAFATTTQSSLSAAAEITVYEPFIANPTKFAVFNAVHDGALTTPDMLFRTGNNSNSTSYDGFELLVSSGTMTGTYAVYGMALS